MNPYKVLGSTNNANMSDVIKTYRELAKKYHPDLAKSDEERQYLSNIFKDLTSAYNQIKNSSANDKVNSKFEIDGDYAKYLVTKIEEFLSKNEVDNALNTLKILERTQKGAKLFFLFAKVYKAKGYYKQAIDYYRKTLETENYNVEALLGLANSYEKIGLKNTALKTYYEVLEWESNNKLALDKINNLQKKETFLEKLFFNFRSKKDKKTNT
ncbi:J domain-containing protein [Desulfurella sp.]|uniref:J domain-containing protein n=1 Tax=Desulfurella sp. TaxID=1962857 RepID=UPI003D12B78A